LAVTTVRHKSKGGKSKNLGGKRNTVGKSYGIKRHDGQFVHKGEVLVNQHGLRFYPGENVRIFIDVHGLLLILELNAMLATFNFKLISIFSDQNLSVIYTSANKF
jgi:ribosomal protein L27